MAERQLKLYAQTTDGGTKTTTTTISNVNPQATSATMKSFAQKLNAFTTNTYQKTDLVETTNVDTETVKTVPTLSIPDTIPVTDTDTIIVPVEYDGDGYLGGYINTQNTSNYQNRALYNSNETGIVKCSLSTSTLPQTYYMQVFATETQNFYATSSERKQVSFVSAS